MLSVIICTHNPQMAYIERVLAALRDQSLPMAEWELLVVDNASLTSLAAQVDLSWHPHAAHIREASLGLTHARLRGIAESSGNTLVFVDDDNVLERDYLEVVVQIGREWPGIGAWSGQLIAEFEAEPPASITPYVQMVGIRRLERDRWSNLPLFMETVPWGAGLCIRRSVAEAWADQMVDADPLRVALDPTGEELLRYGDIDLAFTAADVGLGTGLFTSLRLTHLIPKGRLQLDYLLALHEGNNYSRAVLFAVRGRPPEEEAPWHRALRRCRILLERDRVRRKFMLAGDRGKRRAFADISSAMGRPT